jgi:hypothetical protein
LTIDAVQRGEYANLMTLHLLKLSVGSESVQDLQDWVDTQRAERRRRGLEPVHVHRTRQSPKRRDEIVDGGSMFWVIKGAIMVREAIVDLRATVDHMGVPHCDIVLSGELVQVEPRPFRPFQGWRYLEANDAPRDFRAKGSRDLPPEFVKELATLGLL